MPEPLIRDLLADTDTDATPEPVDVSFERVGGPVHLPSLNPAERAALMAELRPWVAALRARFHIDVRAVPPCWDRHPGMVEALSALRDAERGAYADTSPAGAGIDFLHAVRLVQGFLVDQVALSGCTGHAHRDATARPGSPAQ